MSIKPKPLSIPINHAITWTDNWRGSDHHLKADSFTFDADEFRAVLAEPGVTYIRLYLGLSITKESNEIVEKMICAGVNAEKKDIIHQKVSETAEEDTTGIYDFSHPCPPLCEDNESPLAGG